MGTRRTGQWVGLIVSANASSGMVLPGRRSTLNVDRIDTMASVASVIASCVRVRESHHMSYRLPQWRSTNNNKEVGA